MKLSNTEANLIKPIWKLDKSFLRDRLNEYPDPKLASTIIIILLSRMINKGYINFRQCGNSRKYYPLIKKEVYFSLHLTGLIIELSQIIFWFNPVVVLYNKAIRMTHEFLADMLSLRIQGTCKNILKKS